MLRSSRLLTLLGPPGVGKTRLALEVARASRDDYQHGISWIDLAPVGDSIAVVAAFARGVGLQEVPGAKASGRKGADSTDATTEHRLVEGRLVEGIVSELVDDEMLVVLDNCEHVTTATAALAQTVLERCERVRILATSREALGVVGERWWVVPSLGIPQAGADAATVGESDAGVLFVERASALRPSFALDDAAAPGVIDICRRLDGLPLAIELAAARASVLSIDEIAERLDDRFNLLGSVVSRTIGGRHETLQGALDWSYGLLHDAEKALLRRLSVFSGPTTIDAATHVCAGAPVLADSVVDLMAGLVSKSLVVASTASSPARFRLLETVRAYGAEQLDERERVATEMRHVGWAMQFCVNAEVGLTGDQQPAWLKRVADDYNNVQSALNHCLKAGMASEALTIASGMTLYWRLRGEFSEGRRMLEAALAMERKAEPALRAKALWGAGLLALMVADTDTAADYLVTCLRLAREVGDDRLEARAHLLIGNTRGEQGDARAALRSFDEAAEISDKHSDSWCLAHALALAGQVRMSQGEVEQAISDLERSLSVARAANDDQGLRIALLLNGDAARTQGDFDRADELHREGLAVAERLEEQYAIAVALASLAIGASDRGRFDQARELLSASISASPGPDLSRPVARAVASLAQLALAEGDIEEARVLFEDVRQQNGENFYDFYAELGLANVALSSGDVVMARTGLVKARDLGRWHSLPHHEAEIARLEARICLAEGQRPQALALFQKALRSHGALGDVARAADDLETIAGLTDGQEAVRSYAAAERIREQTGYARGPIQQESYVDALARAKESMPAKDFDGAWQLGRHLSLDDAIELATRSGGRKRRGRATWAELTSAEEEVVSLAAQGLTNPQIGERLYISRNTVKSHLSSAFAKLGIGSRFELAQEAMRREADRTPQ